MPARGRQALHSSKPRVGGQVVRVRNNSGVDMADAAISTPSAPTERDYWLLLNMVGGIGPVRFARLLSVCGDARQAWNATDLQLMQAGLERRAADALRALRSRVGPEGPRTDLARLGAEALTLLDDAYPEVLRQVADPPPVLYLKGSLPDAALFPYLAVVGTRRLTAYGRAVAERLAGDLASAGVTIVSGLARGIDTIAHRAALDAGGRTVAVLGNGLDQVYPVENTALARRMVEDGRGALLTEFAPGVRPDAPNFPRRNRIVAGLCAGTLIVEAGERSGALITADFALEQGREVMAVPGSILNPMSAGPNGLIKQGAVMVTEARDVLDALNLAIVAPSDDPAVFDAMGLSDEEQQVLGELGAEPRHVDELARGLGQPAASVSATLTLLELRGLARNMGSMAYVRSSAR